MKTLSSIEVNFIVTELKSLEGARLDKVFEQENEFVIKLYKLKNIFLDIIPGHFVIIAQEKSFESEPSQFCMILRKYLTSATLDKVEQIDFERIIKFSFRYKEQCYDLIVELFGTGNIILTKENKIISCKDKREFKDRKVIPGVEYQKPPSNAPNLKQIQQEEFSELLDKSKKESMVKKLAIDFGLGGVFAEEILIRSDIDKNKSKIDDKQKQAILSEIKEMLTSYISANISDNQAYPIKMLTKTSQEDLESFSQAIEKTKDVITPDSKKDQELESLNSILTSQQEQLKELESKIIQYKEIGDSLYKNYNEIDQLIKEVKDTKWKTSNPKITEKLPDQYKIVIEL